ncbi:MBL fold metallo-hydrolase [Tessaracoccus oleiagri]|uniref:Glyoxylase, beta-lactamase superfamily II n=1 Tax=Tessaracoccus oleiagri TaxID=686624 RepID=A0A1G9HAS5_9ACTN|nr:MBL fold metallo-hydrolase [Tessaracoccus oleiagri]SDL09985.1 Glyoxylase, beta-lactamase superfamily II [Tessaracoccus oleiagri]
MSTARIERLVTAGNADPEGPPEHENNVWIVGDDRKVVVVDPAHDAEAVLDAVGGREVVAVLLTHGHWDHSRSAPEFAAMVHAPIFLGEADLFLWEDATGLEDGFAPLSDGAEFEVAGTTLRAVSTPGHTPGSTSIRIDELGAVLSGDTLFPGGPGATRWDYSSFATVIASVRDKLFTLPDDTVVHPGHGESTTIGAEKPHLDEWIARGW